MNSSSTTLLEKFYHWEKSIPDQTFLRQPIEGQWVEYSFKRTGDEIRRMANYLKGLGLPEGCKVALLSKNCAHWIIADVAIWMAGYVSVPLYPTLTAGSIKQILDHSESKVIFLGTSKAKAFTNKTKNATKKKMQHKNAIACIRDQI